MAVSAVFACSSIGAGTFGLTFSSLVSRANWAGFWKGQEKSQRFRFDHGNVRSCGLNDDDGDGGSRCLSDDTSIDSTNVPDEKNFTSDNVILEKEELGRSLHEEN